MSDQLTAAAEALGIPEQLVSRSAEARAQANGTSTDAILSAWSGGAPAAAPAKEAAPEAPETPEKEEAEAPAPAERAPAPEPAPLPTAIPEPALAREAEAEPVEETLEPVDLSVRLRTTGRIGTWTGAILGLFAFVISAATWSQNVTVAGEETLRPVFVIDPDSVLIGVALVSIVFGGVVAALSRAAASWANPAMQLKSSRSSTAWIGAVVGLVLGIAGGAVLASGFATPIEGSEEGFAQLPVLSTLFVMLIGGAVLGGLTTLTTQFFGVPIAVDEPEEEVDTVRRRLGNAVGIPVAGLLLLAVLVLPFAWTLIESNHITSGGAAIIAIITASGILAFSALAGSQPNVRIGRGELLVAVLGIGIVVLILFAVLTNLSDDHSEESGEEAAAVLVIS
ncbi:MAG: hypothetical protein DWQ40_02560 [Actinobacteria bacterium]|nr:MAG: hypothetical protein DWQ40_02560 [Actinomycetota bacterium]REK37061.1 MAG: hypothetical protein DWQ20_05160 [Actinomycetota bacterium]